MDRWQEYLYRRHDVAELRDWARRLQHFRFCRAFGGHANDGDQLVLALKYSGAADLKNVWNELGAPGPLASSSTLAGIPIAITVLDDRVLLSLSGADGDPFEVTATDVANALALEAALALHPERKVDPPIDDEHCISPKHYSEIWEST
jgi:hypothetical protein